MKIRQTRQCLLRRKLFSSVSGNRQPQSKFFQKYWKFVVSYIRRSCWRIKVESRLNYFFFSIFVDLELRFVVTKGEDSKRSEPKEIVHCGSRSTCITYITYWTRPLTNSLINICCSRTDREPYKLFINSIQRRTVRLNDSFVSAHPIWYRAFERSYSQILNGADLSRSNTKVITPFGSTRFSVLRWKLRGEPNDSASCFHSSMFFPLERICKQCILDI